ncbi:MAG: protein-disulfide reductase DsbD domain-containing protein [Verrucomicrobiota bacterium]
MMPTFISRPLLLAGTLLSLALVSACSPPPPAAVEGEVIQKPGVTLQWLTDHDRIAPGDSFTVGLLIQHDPGFHTYWRSPGIVGLAPAIGWDLPEGITAGPIQWPGPEVTKMAKIVAWGYERDVLLTTTIKVDPDFSEAVIPLKSEVSWMACSDTCHPGWANLALEIPTGPSYPNQANAELFERAIDELPIHLPADWKFHLSTIASNESEWTVVQLESPEKLSADGAVFFCGDNQVNSDLPQTITETAGGLELRFPHSEFAPEDATVFEGLLFHPEGWPSLESRWVRVSAPLP